MPIFEALNAEHGDCLLVHYEVDGLQSGQKVRQLWLIDGGPTVTYQNALAPRLSELQPTDGKPLNIRLGIVTHIDDDHIDGMATLANALVATQRPAGTPDVRFTEFWFNGFVATFGDPVTPSGHVASLASGGMNNTLLAGLSTTRADEATMFLQGVADGERLLNSLASFKTPQNAPLKLNVSFGNDAFQKAVAPRNVRLSPVTGPTLLVLTPSHERLEELKQKWAKAIKSTAELQSLVRGSIDKSVANLSSIVFLATIDGKTMLLTGDGLAEDIIAGWEAIEGNTTPVEIDLMKVPHHGSTANNSVELFRLFPAKHYVFCANGKHDNPDMETLKKLFEARGDAAFTIHMTALESNPAIAKQVTFLKQKRDAPGSKVKLLFRQEGDLSIAVVL